LIVTIFEIHMLLIDVLLLKNSLNILFIIDSFLKFQIIKILFQNFKAHGEKYINHRFYLKLKHAYL